MQQNPFIAINGAAALSSLGTTLGEIRAHLASGERGLKFGHRFAAITSAPLGEIPWEKIGIRESRGKEADDLLWQGSRYVLSELRHLFESVSPERSGLFVGTTTAGISGFFAMNRERRTTGKSVHSLLNPDMQQAFASHKLAEEFRIQGPVYTFSTSCVASSQAFAMAHDALLMGWIDRAIVLGVDVLNPTTIHGFDSLQLLDYEYCEPFTAERKGINLSEAVVGLVLQRESDSSRVRVKSHAALSEAHHMTQPAPSGVWMKACMEKALIKASVSAEEIDRINPHATGTLLNDEAEMEAIRSLFGSTEKAFPSKRLSGHALGASGALEILLTMLELEDQGLRYGLKNSFGFGGANLSLLLERVSS